MAKKEMAKVWWTVIGVYSTENDSFHGLQRFAHWVKAEDAKAAEEKVLTDHDAHSPQIAGTVAGKIKVH